MKRMMNASHHLGNPNAMHVITPSNTIVMNSGFLQFLLSEYEPITGPISSINAVTAEAAADQYER